MSDMACLTSPQGYRFSSYRTELNTGDSLNRESHMHYPLLTLLTQPVIPKLPTRQAGKDHSFLLLLKATNCSAITGSGRLRRFEKVNG